MFIDKLPSSHMFGLVYMDHIDIKGTNCRAHDYDADDPGADDEYCIMTYDDNMNDNHTEFCCASSAC